MLQSKNLARGNENHGYVDLTNGFPKILKSYLQVKVIFLLTMVPKMRRSWMMPILFHQLPNLPRPWRKLGAIFLESRRHNLTT